jgi:hypothetical protein
MSGTHRQERNQGSPFYVKNQFELQVYVKWERFVSHNLRATTTVDAKVDGFATECVHSIVDTDLT